MTLNQIKQQLEAIATNHKQVNSFGWGDIWEIATSGTIDYPLMWVKLESSSIANKRQTMNFKFIFCDLVSNGEVNEDDVLSDQLETVKDVLAQLQHPNYDWSFDAESVTIESFTERFNDSVSGWVADIGLELPYVADRCAMPYEGNTSSNYACPKVTILDENGNIIDTIDAGGSYVTTGGGACADATVENSDDSYSDTVASGGTLVLPDTTYNVYVDNVLQSSVNVPSLKNETINILWQ